MKKLNIKMSVVILFVVALSFLLYGCSSSPAVHNENEIKKDMVGKEFYAKGDKIFGGSIFKITNEPDIKSVNIIKRLTSEKDKTDEVYVNADLENNRYKISGEIRLNYRLYDTGWGLDSIERASEEDMATEYKLPHSPTPEKIKEDLEGKEIKYKAGYSVVLKSVEGIKDLTIKSTKPEDVSELENRTSILNEVIVDITLGDSTKTIKGQLRMFYIFDRTKFDDGWVFDRIDWTNQQDFIEQ